MYKRGVITNIFNTLFDNYQKVKLSTIGTFKSGIGFKESLQGHIDLEIPFYKVSDMNSEANTITMQIANNYVSQSMVKDLKTTPFDKDSIIFAKVGAALFMERKRIAHSPFLIDNNMMAFQPGTDVNFDYIFAFFQYTKLSSYAQVGALPSLNASDIGEIQIPIPQHEQQKKVAFIAKKLEQEIDNQSAYFAHLNDIKRGILQQMFI